MKHPMDARAFGMSYSSPVGFSSGQAPGADLVAELAPSIAELAQTLIGAPPTIRGREDWRFHPKGSLVVKVAGPKQGAWFDHAAGVGGDALGLVAHLMRCPMRDAAAWARSWLGTDRSRYSPVTPQLLPRVSEASESGTAELARRLWAEAVAPAGTLVETYLASRGLTLPEDAPLRFHPNCPRVAERWPAMLAQMTDPETGAPCGVHRTFLAHDGKGKAPGNAKMMAGNAGIIRLVPDEEVTGGLGIAEGIETALSVMQEFGWTPVWAATSAGGITRFPVLAGIEALTIFADADDNGAGMKAAKACGERWANAGREATIASAPAGSDFADLRGIAA
jgi:putative DNA primase/helicase